METGRLRIIPPTFEQILKASDERLDRELLGSNEPKTEADYLIEVGQDYPTYDDIWNS